MALRKANKTQSQTSNFQQERRKQTRDFTTLVTQLNHNDPQQRRWAARDLLQFKEKSIEPLCQRLELEDDPSVQEVILDILQIINQEPAAELLIPFLSSQDAGLRNKVIETLQAMPDLMEKHVEKLLQNSDPDIRIFALNILQSLKHEHVPQWLLLTAMHDDHINVVATALDGLTEVATPEMIEDLKSVAARFPDDDYIQFIVNDIVQSLQE
ncbi:HEAT repeat domain-containing protein [Desulfovulcanus sp.]